MLHFSVDDVKGKVINEGTIHERRVKLFASPDCKARRDGYGCGLTIIDPGQIHEEHAHPDSEEFIHVVQGTGTARIAGQDMKIQPGDLIAIEKGEPHTFTNTGNDQLCLYWVYSPPGPEKRFLDD